jgi:hypothetical protein
MEDALVQDAGESVVLLYSVYVSHFTVYRENVAESYPSVKHVKQRNFLKRLRLATSYKSR